MSGGEQDRIASPDYLIVQSNTVEIYMAKTTYIDLKVTHREEDPWAGSAGRDCLLRGRCDERDFHSKLTD